MRYIFALVEEKSWRHWKKDDGWEGKSEGVLWTLSRWKDCRKWLGAGGSLAGVLAVVGTIGRGMLVGCDESDWLWVEVAGKS